MNTLPLRFTLKNPDQQHLGIAVSVIIHAGLFSALAISEQPLTRPSFQYPMIEVAGFSVSSQEQSVSRASADPINPLPKSPAANPTPETRAQSRSRSALRSATSAIKESEPSTKLKEPISESIPTDSATTSVSHSAETTGSADSTTPPDFRSASLHNPPTTYPMMAARRGIQGTVKLKVQVLPNGEPGAIELAASSGSEVLDESAMEQVRKWHFIPARRRNIAVPGWVIVPLVFELKR